MADKSKLSHDEAMDLITGACTVSFLSYEEAIAVYLRARGVLSDGAKTLGAPIPRSARLRKLKETRDA